MDKLENRDSLLGTAEGKFVLISGDKILGEFDTEADAIRQGYAQLGNVPFLVKQVVQLLRGLTPDQQFKIRDLQTSLIFREPDWCSRACFRAGGMNPAHTEDVAGVRRGVVHGSRWENHVRNHPALCKVVGLIYETPTNPPLRSRVARWGNL